MAVGQHSIPEDLRPVTLNRAFDPHSRGSSLVFSPSCVPFPNPPPPWATTSATNHPFSSFAAAVTPPAYSPPSSSSAAASYPDGNSSHPKKIKFLCSFGGRILLRPNDGSLRYVGGQTRIISVRKDVSFAELMSKIAEASGGTAVVKYQLPGEDLDALVSVSCPEDVVNMLEEYDKLAATLPDGSAKLRAFLFSPRPPTTPGTGCPPRPTWPPAPLAPLFGPGFLLPLYSAQQSRTEVKPNRRPLFDHV